MEFPISGVVIDIHGANMRSRAYIGTHRAGADSAGGTSHDNPFIVQLHMESSRLFWYGSGRRFVSRCPRNSQIVAIRGMFRLLLAVQLFGHGHVRKT